MSGGAVSDVRSIWLLGPLMDALLDLRLVVPTAVLCALQEDRRDKSPLRSRCLRGVCVPVAVVIEDQTHRPVIAPLALNLHVAYVVNRNLPVVREVERLRGGCTLVDERIGILVIYPCVGLAESAQSHNVESELPGGGVPAAAVRRHV